MLNTMDKVEFVIYMLLKVRHPLFLHVHDLRQYNLTGKMSKSRIAVATENPTEKTKYPVKV